VLIIDTVIAPMIHAQQIAYALSGSKEGEPPSLEAAISELDKWLESGDVNNMTPEERERAMVWGFRG
jgi:hypothetical protein